MTKDQIWAEIGKILSVAIAVYLPSIVNALRSYKESTGWRRAVGIVFDALAIHPKADSPGTFKVPLTLSKPPNPTVIKIADVDTAPSEVQP